MKLTKVVLFVITICTSNAFNNLLTPSNKEVIYDWRATLSASSNGPQTFASFFSLHGKIHLQASNNTTHVQITDLTYKIYNGLHDNIQETSTKSLPLPREPKDLLKVFKIVYNTKGLIEGIATESKEKEFSRNIKRAIASIFQMDDSVLSKVYQKPESFIVKEKSIHGLSSFVYDVLPKGDNLGVHKFHEFPQDELYRFFSTNTEQLHCDAPYEQVITRSSWKKYLISQNITKQITANGTLTYYPFKAKTEPHYIHVSQKFELAEVVPIEHHFKLESELFENHLNYHLSDKSEDGSVDDITNGRRSLNSAKLINIAEESIAQMCTYNEDDLQKEEAKNKNVKRINRIQDILLKFNFDNLETLRSNLVRKNKCVDTFYLVLPVVGTEASTLYIKDLVVTKKVNDKSAIALLEQFPESVLTPTTDLLEKLEILIHLNDEYHWKVRKAAVLGFGALIHKSYTFTKESQAYEKYVLEYVEKLKNSTDYKTQMFYILGLTNMKVPSIKTHLAPGFKGDEHLRFLTLMAVGQSILSNPNPDDIITFLWPIFINRYDFTELRIAAYYFIMQSQPTSSRLRNVFAAMLTEPDEEVYSFHYSYIKALAESKNPCNQEKRVRMAQLLRSSPPPRHGLSSINLLDYEDAYSGFGASLQKSVIRTNRSCIYFLSRESQEFNILNHDYGVYLKVHDFVERGCGDLKTVFQKLLVYKLPIRIEVAVSQHGNIIKGFYWDQNNADEVEEILKFFNGESGEFQNQFLYYQQTSAAVLPLDLGVPAFWEFQMPEVSQHSFKFRRVNVSVSIEYKFVNWIYYRHGLTAYNPFVDAWQGINRIHTFDAVLPINLNISFIREPSTLIISWKKHNDPLMNVAGLRTYVKQVVFVRCDHDKNFVAKSNPHAKPSVDVGYYGKNRQYQIVEVDDLNTGHKWSVSFFDSSVPTTHSEFKHLFFQTFTKEFNNPLEHLLLSLHNLQRFLLLSPIPGNYGFLVRIEPSKKHPVSTIHVTIPWNFQETNASRLYTPGSKWDARITYDIKNQNEILKRWDVEASIEQNVGHTVNNFKMVISRTIPGQKEYRISVDGVKKWLPKSVEGYLNVELSNEQCTTIHVSMIGNRSVEQEQGNQYYACQYHTLQCLVSHSTVRHYVYNVQTANVSSEFKSTAQRLWNQFASQYHSFDGEPTDATKIDVKYSVQENKVDLTVGSQSLTGVPTDHLKWFGFKPDSLAYSSGFIRAYKTDRVSRCVVHPDRYTLNQYTFEEVVPDNWTLYVGDIVDKSLGVYVKRVTKDTIAVKATEFGHSIEIEPVGDSHRIIVDGQVVPPEQSHKGWVYYHVFVQDFRQPVAVILQHSGFHFEYDGRQVTVVVPFWLFIGRCFKYR